MDLAPLIAAMYSVLTEWSILNSSIESFDTNDFKNKKMLDSFRLTLEPHVYQYLVWNYGKALDSFWKTYIPPKKSNVAFVLYERRPHHNLWFLLRNMAWANPNASVYIFCSDLNRHYIEMLLGDKKDHFNIIEYIHGAATRENGKINYNKNFTQRNLYSKIHAEYIITTQVDTFFRKRFTNELCIGSYWGNSWVWNQTAPGGGGITVRKISDMLKILPEVNDDEDINKLEGYEDSWISAKIMEMNLPYPPYEIRRSYLMENEPALDPIGVHQFWTFILNFNPNNPQLFIETVKNTLTLVGLE